MIWLIFFSSIVMSLVLTEILRRYALARSILDIPNNRSSHTRPTPRGGGVAIVVTFLSMAILFELSELSSFSSIWILIIAGSWIAIIGLMDDIKHIPARWRLLSHFIAASVAVAWLGGLPPLLVFGSVFDLSLWGHIGVIFYLVWLLNLYNFMDGIDGIAAIEAITVCMGGGLLHWLSGGNSATWELPFIFVGSIIGFLYWNFPKAKIFMGDAGSGFIGFIIGLFTIYAAWGSTELFWGWIILLGAFVIDSTVTLVRRIKRGEKFYEAHRSHAYQYASRKYNSHMYVTIAYGSINLFWLLPVATLVVTGIIDGMLALVIAYLPLIWLAVHFKAGAKELQLV